jgi:hypothetical protein
MTTDDPTRTAGKTSRLIPGARERNALTSRKPGSGGFATRLTVPTPVGSSMDAVTVAAHQREGGGAPNQRTPSPDKK